MSDDRAIRDVIERWMDATRRGDTASVLDLMTDDVIFLAPGREPFGKEVFRVASAAMTGMTIDGDHHIEELHVIGDHAYVRSRITVTVTMPDEKVLRHGGHGLSIFRKDDRGWRLARDANLVAVTGSSQPSAS
ncbi:MAG: SgcJ/EcaC family oxidoreductase [Labilithrix sp.]|nr:SgcJ/EcaC family oxidoreductase [Labilithrix sp.]